MKGMSLTGGAQIAPVSQASGESRIPLLPSEEKKLQTFDRNVHFTVGGNDPRAKYRRHALPKQLVKWGQLKLLNSEVQFLTLFWSPQEVPKPHVVYAGAALGTHIALLADLFPDCTFHLYDDRDFDAVLSRPEYKGRININQRLFSDDEAKSFAERKDVFFISDIRTTSYNREEGLTQEQQRLNESLVEGDMNAQQKWTQIIRPVRALLKFRLPYSYDFVVQAGKTRRYLDGLVFKQQFGPGTTTEGRLVPYSDLRMRDWDYEAYESMMFYHNTRTRVSRFINPLTGGNQQISVPLGLTNDYDSTATTMIYVEYLRKIGIKADEKNVLILLTRIIERTNLGRTNLVGLRSGVKVL